MKYPAYLLIGAPGSGKGTQGTVLGTLRRFYHFACGDVFRRINTRTPLGRTLLEYSSKGHLVPDEVAVELWRVTIAQAVESHAFKPDLDEFVLEGILRNARQAELMRELIDIRRVFHLSCPDREQVVARPKKRALKDNRVDDANEEVIRRRLDTCERESRPLLDYFGPEPTVPIDASRASVAVLHAIPSHIVRDHHVTTA